MNSQEFFARFLRVTSSLYSPNEQREGLYVRRLTEPLAKSTIKSAAASLIGVNHNNCD
jgi:hypothetical protein